MIFVVGLRDCHPVHILFSAASCVCHVLMIKKQRLQTSEGKLHRLDFLI